MKGMIKCALENSQRLLWKNAFSKFRQSSGGEYFISVEHITEKFRIQMSKLYTTLNDVQILLC